MDVRSCFLCLRRFFYGNVGTPPYDKTAGVLQVL